MDIIDLEYVNGKEEARLALNSADNHTTYLASEFIEELRKHMETLALFMPNPERHNAITKITYDKLSSFLWRVVPYEQHQEVLDEKVALEKKLEKLKNELSV